MKSIVNKILREAVVKPSVLDTIKKDIYSFRPEGSSGRIETFQGDITSEFRYLGNWIDDEEDGYYREEEGEEDWREDNDQRKWAPGEYERFLKIFTKWASNFPWFKKVKLYIHTDEKDWCTFGIGLIKK